MKKLVLVLMVWASSSLSAIPRTCVLYYPKTCSPVIENMQVAFNCKSERDRKFVTEFGLMDFFRSPYMPETLKFVPHNLDHFVWVCPD